MSNTGIRLIETVNAQAKTWKFSDVTAAAGALHSNIDDLLLFLEVVLRKEGADNNLNLALDRMEQIETNINEKESMALGWKVHNQDRPIFYHGGITKGYKSLLAADIENQKGIIILTDAGGLSRKENTLLKKFAFEYLVK